MSYEKQLCCQKINVGFLDRGVCPEEGFVSREKRAEGMGWAGCGREKWRQVQKYLGIIS